jgi:hypothetical protein
MFIARSNLFYPGFTNNNQEELSDEIIIPSYHLNKMMERFETGERLYVNIKNTLTKRQCLVAIGAPHGQDKKTIFAPQWILDLIDCTGLCDSPIMISKADVTNIPIVTKIVIKPLDPVAFELNTLECFERAFMNLHSITAGITIPIPIPDLGYSIFAYIERVEPADTSLIIEGEVNVEFINDFEDAVAERVAAIEDVAAIDEVAAIEEVVEEEKKVVEELTPDQRKAAIRESWSKRF